MKTKILLIVCALITQLSISQWTEIGSPILGEADLAFFGGDVTVSGDGNFMAASQWARGTSANSQLPNPVIVYQRNGENWVEIDRIESSTPNMPGSLEERFGRGIEFNEDGTRLVIGTAFLSFDPVNNVGRAEVHERQADNTFAQLGSNIINPGTGSFFGASVSISGDGNTIAIGRPLIIPGDFTGAVFVYKFDGTDWTQEGQKLGDVPATDSFYGEGVTLNQDGTVLGVGIQRNTPGTFQGGLEVFQLFNGTWGRIGDRIQGASGSFFGKAVDITPDGNTIVVGANANNDVNAQFPYVEIYQRAGASYVLKGNRIQSDLGLTGLGTDVGISDDGNTIVVGLPLSFNDDTFDETGEINIYTFQNGTWTLNNSFLGFGFFESLGESVAISGNGGVILAGGPDFSADGFETFGAVRTYFNNTLSIDENTFANEISVFPNPAKDLVTINLGENQDLANVTMYDLAGRTVNKQSFVNETALTVNINNVATGVYMLRVANDKGNTATIRIMKE